MKFLVLDGSSLIYRAFYALPLLQTTKGDFTNAIFGFSSMLVRLLKDFDPDLAVNCIDASRKTFRTEMFSDYKAQRDKTPDELLSQIQPIIELCQSLGIKTISKQNFEADDLIGTLASQSAKLGINTAIVTGDRDALQLLRPNLRVFFTRKGTQNLQIYDESSFQKEFQITPKQLIDLKALQGDKSDNIPGVPNVGSKTATQLLVEFGSVENLLKRIDLVPTRIRSKILESKDQIELSKKLATIDQNVPDLKFDSDDFRLHVDFRRLAEFCKRYELNKPLEHFKDLFAFRLNFDLTVDENTIDLFHIPQVQSEAVDEIQDGVTIYVRDLKSMLKKHPEISENLDKIFDVGIANYLVYPDESTRTKKIPPKLNEDQLLNLGRKLKLELESQNLSKLYREIELPLVPILAQMELVGMAVDRGKIFSKSYEIGEKLDSLIREIYSLAGGKFNINSTKQLGELLFEKLKLPTQKKTKRGYSTDVEVLESLKSQHPIVAKILDYRTLTKLKSTYLDGIGALIDPKSGRVHAKFHQTIAATGRLSSSDPNLQNVPVRTEMGRSIRELFIPGKDFDALLSADYSQIELRILAHMSGDENFIKSFLAGEDIHSRTAAEVFGVPIDQVTSELRRHAKAVNFGIVYGISDFGLSKDLKISRKDAGGLIAKFYDRYPGVKKFLDETIEFARNHGFTETMFGRRRYLPALLSPNFYTRSVAERMAMNTPIQGSAADIIKLAMIRVAKNLKIENLKSRIILQVHDELILEVVENEIDQVKNLVKESMENVANLKIPLLVDINVGKNWAEV